MAGSKRIRVHESFIDAMGTVARPIAEKLKKQHNLQTLVLDYPTLSSIMAGELKKRPLKFRVEKINRNTGRIVFL